MKRPPTSSSKAVLLEALRDKVTGAMIDSAAVRRAQFAAVELDAVTAATAEAIRMAAIHAANLAALPPAGPGLVPDANDNILNAAAAPPAFDPEAERVALDGQLQVQVEAADAAEAAEAAEVIAQPPRDAHAAAGAADPVAKLLTSAKLTIDLWTRLHVYLVHAGLIDARIADGSTSILQFFPGHVSWRNRTAGQFDLSAAVANVAPAIGAAAAAAAAEPTARILHLVPHYLLSALFKCEEKIIAAEAPVPLQRLAVADHTRKNRKETRVAPMSEQDRAKAQRAAIKLQQLQAKLSQARAAERTAWTRPQHALIAALTGVFATITWLRANGGMYLDMQWAVRFMARSPRALSLDALRADVTECRLQCLLDDDDVAAFFTSHVLPLLQKATEDERLAALALVAPMAVDAPADAAVAGHAEPIVAAAVLAVAVPADNADPMVEPNAEALAADP
jgi:hypothetical protein